MKETKYKIVSKKKLAAVRILDSVLYGLSKIGFFKSNGKETPAITSSDIQRILVIRLAYIGDVIMTFPVLPALRHLFPNAEIDVLTSHTAAPLLQNNPHVSGVIRWNAPWFYPQSKERSFRQIRQEIQSSGYDLGIDFRGDIRNIYYCLWKTGIPRRLSYDSGGGGLLLTNPVPWTELKHKVDYHLDLLRGLNYENTPGDPLIYLTEEEIDAAAERIRQHCSSSVKPVAVHPGARLPLKRWKTERFKALIRNLQDELHRPVILLGGEDDRDRADLIVSSQPVTVDFTGQLSIRELAAVMRLCEVVIFGPSRPIETAPCGRGQRIIEGSCAAKDFCDEKRCSVSNPRSCIDSISVERVTAVCRDVFSSH